MSFAQYFTPKIIRTKEDAEADTGNYRFLTLDIGPSTAKELSLFHARVFHQKRAFLFVRVSIFDADINMLFDFIHITFNWSLR